MRNFVLIAAICTSMCNALPAINDSSVEDTMPTPELIEHRGYPAETHEVTTEDGYILSIHRIPNPGKPVAFIQHGLLCSSADFLVNANEKALGFALWDAGYDIWLGNFRGNTYNLRHVSFPTNSSDFWKFSWDEMGRYDLPAMLNYVLATTGEAQLNYIGHSMGTTTFFVAMELHPELNDKIKIMIGLGPVATVANMKSPIRVIAPYARELEWISEYLGLYEFLPSNEFFHLAGETLCRETSPYVEVCSNILFLIAGYDSPELDPALLPIILGHTPAGTSTRTVVHYAQEYNDKSYAWYDFGIIGNYEHYDQRNQPLYHAQQVKAPVVLLWAQNDLLAVPEDVAWLASQLPNLQGYERVGTDLFNHLDFLWARDADIYVVQPVLRYLEAANA